MTLYICPNPQSLQAFPGGASGKRTRLPMQVRHKRRQFDPFREDPLEKGMATQSSILALRIPWTEEPGGLQSME